MEVGQAIPLDIALGGPDGYALPKTGEIARSEIEF